jgi:hypothetical protein
MTQIGDGFREAAVPGAEYSLGRESVALAVSNKHASSMLDRWNG